VNLLLDTNVISEPTRKNPAPAVLRWLAEQPEHHLFLSVLTLGELRRGILLLDDSRKHRALLRWLENEIEPAFAGRVLDIDAAVMRAWAELQNTATRRGRSVPVLDGLIAATALAHNLTLATRNTADFLATGVPLLDPWHD